MSNATVRFEQVSKQFRLGANHDSLRDLLSAGVGRLFGRGGERRGRSNIWALKNVSFAAAPGEALGIIGPNGAGKSTALRLLAGILRPDEGEVHVRGRLSALIEVGAGFHGDLTGRENIFLNGAILGMSRAEIRSKLDAIVEFAGLERFLDTPVKRYSSGMYARLGFSIAAHVDPEVLLVDEVLSVGDAVFRLRCFERMRELVESGTALVFVTHNLEQMQAICPRALVLDGGTVAYEGDARLAVSHYLEAMSHTYYTKPTDLPAGKDGRQDTVELVDLKVRNAAGEQVAWAQAGTTLEAELTLRLRRPIRRLVVELNLRAHPRENLLSFNSARMGRYFETPAGCQRFRLSLPGLPLAGGQYFWIVRVWDHDTGVAEVDTPRSFPLVIDDQGRATGTLAVEHDWHFLPSDEEVQGEQVAVEVGETPAEVGA